MSSDRSLLAIAAAITAIVLASIALVVAVGNRPAESFPPDSPQAAVQGYLTAWEAGDDAATYAFFSAEVQGRMSLDDFRRAAEDQRGPGYKTEGRRRVFIDRVNESGTHAEVQLTVEEYLGEGVFGASVYRSTRLVPMVREHEAWKIDELLIGLEPGSPYFPEKFGS